MIAPEIRAAWTGDDGLVSGSDDLNEKYQFVFINQLINFSKCKKRKKKWGKVKKVPKLGNK